MRYRGLDLNLLVALDALLRKRSVSQAAQAANITQPAMSAALARLRSYFGDQLLITKGGKSTLSPFAETLGLSVAETLRRIDASIIAQPAFDPLVSEREFRLLAADTIILGFLAQPLLDITRTAPNLRLDLVSPHDQVLEKLESGDVDLLIVPAIYASARHPQEPLAEEDHCVIACRHSYPSKRLSLAEYEAADHVEVFVGTGRDPYLPPELLARLGITRRIVVKLDHFALVPFFVRGTRRLATFPGMTAELYGSFAPLKIFAPPFDLPSVQLVMQWHTRANRDAGIAWLRDSIRKHLAASGHRSRLYRLLPKTI